MNEVVEDLKKAIDEVTSIANTIALKAYTNAINIIKDATAILSYMNARVDVNSSAEFVLAVHGTAEVNVLNKKLYAEVDLSVPIASLDLSMKGISIDGYRLIYERGRIKLVISLFAVEHIVEHAVKQWLAQKEEVKEEAKETAAQKEAQVKEEAAAQKEAQKEALVKEEVKEEVEPPPPSPTVVVEE